MARHTQITQNNKFATSLHYLKTEVSDEVDFFHADKHESLLQIYTMIMMGMVKHLQYLYNILNKKLEMKLTFCMQISFLTDFNTLGIKVSYKLKLKNLTF